MKIENRDLLLSQQKREITQHKIYEKLAKRCTSKNKKILIHMSKDELHHYKLLKKITKKDVGPSSFLIFIYSFLSKLFGLTFSLKLMERRLEFSQNNYKKIKKYSGLNKLLKDSKKHEKNILNLLREERVEYANFIILGLNDALVELTGAMAGLTFALQNTRLIGFVGLITGIAAAMSMAASGYLSSREEKGKKTPLKSASYTGIAYIVTVILLITPYFLFRGIYSALIGMFIVVLIIIALYTFYISTAKNLNFKRRFLEMAGISLTVAVISFFIGYLIRILFGIEV